MFRKINIATIAARFGSRKSLETAFENGVSLMNTLDNTTILDITNKANVFNHIVYQKILSDSKFLFDRQDDIFFSTMIRMDSQYSRDCINNLFMNSEFIDGTKNPLKGKIVNDKIIETDQRFLSENDRKNFI